MMLQMNSKVLSKGTAKHGSNAGLVLRGKS